LNKGIGISRASRGRAAVFLPLNLPNIVIKDVHQGAANWGVKLVDYVTVSKCDMLSTRFGLSLKKRVVCKIQLQKCIQDMGSSSLVVPKTLCEVSHGRFLLEEKLDISSNMFHNYHLYHNNRDAFNNAVCDMVTLFSKNYFCDLIREDKYSFWCKTNVSNEFFSHVLYDNIPLYMERNSAQVNEGRIGLIDTEDFYYDCGESIPGDKLALLARIFPLHIDLIKSQGELLGMCYNEEQLKIISDKSLAHFKYLYTDHADWLKQKNQSHKKYIEKFKVGIKTRMDLASYIKTKIQNNPLFDGIYNWKLRGKGTIEMRLVNLITDWIGFKINKKADLLKEPHEDLDGFTINPEVINARSLRLDNNDDWCNFVSEAMGMLNPYCLLSISNEREDFVLRIMELCLDKMVEDDLLFRVETLPEVYNMKQYLVRF